ncbi:MAG: PIN domain-containing protein [Vicinamibacteria bacterium]|nr:PIN domain-containing protein [Vicinamibacteria bacterium]
MLLVDTSVWVEVFARPARVDLATLVDLDEIVTTLPVIQEVLQGFRDEHAYRLAREALFSFPVADSPLPAERFEEAAQLFRLTRRAGKTIRSGVDCLIAATAIAHRLTVLHRDRDFTALSSVSVLQHRNTAE